MARTHFVSDTEFFLRVKADLTVSERSICEDVMEDLQLSAEVMGQMLRVASGAHLYRLLADHLQADPNVPDRLGTWSRINRVVREVDLEQLSLLRGVSEEAGGPASGESAK